MVFVTTGLGGGTGTGAAPIIASLACEMGALTVAVVTKPFSFEGKRRMQQAERGIAELMESVDTTIVIPNEKLLAVAENAGFFESFRIADDILRQGVQGISDIITIPGLSLIHIYRSLLRCTRHFLSLTFLDGPRQTFMPRGLIMNTNKVAYWIALGALALGLASEYQHGNFASLHRLADRSGSIVCKIATQAQRTLAFASVLMSRDGTSARNLCLLYTSMINPRGMNV